ncbi:MAG TPA: nucleotidyltransferase domain-containing protein [Candidatus Woesearchaeota archaeon]|nr:nucleotidyltransferase domain-containing protein [Candidatus Woesearchaeota archaeon]
MAKAKKEQKETKKIIKVVDPKVKEEQKSIIDKIESNIPKDAQEKLLKIKENIEEFSKKIVAKFEGYVLGVCLLPKDAPKKPLDDEDDPKKPDVKPNENAIRTLVLIDDSDSTKMSKQELKDKISSIVDSFAKETMEGLESETLLLSELWTMCLDAKYDYLAMIAKSVTIFDKGIVAAIRIAEVHKTMVLSKFEKYIVSYVLAGSTTQGRATEKSDVDVFVVIDDTDVKRMTRAELKDKLRAIIIGMGVDAGEITGIKNKINIQVYILTEFWDSLREANPVIFTLLRDGIPFYDRGTFTPWKQLLKMGKIKPSQEAIDMFLTTGDQILKRVERRLTDIGMEDMYYAILTPSQAALMLYGVPPTTPRETVDLLRQVFVENEKLLENEYVDILSDVIKARKDVEHGTKSRITGKEIDEFLTKSQKYLERVNKLFEQIQTKKEGELINGLYADCMSVARNIILDESELKSVASKDIFEKFQEILVDTNKIPSKICDQFKKVIEIKKEDKSLNKVDVEKYRKSATEFIKYVLEYMDRKRAKIIEQHKIKIRYGNKRDKISQLAILKDEIFFIKDMAEQNNVLKYDYKDGKISGEKKIGIDDLDKAIMDNPLSLRPVIDRKLIEFIESNIGKEYDIILM